MSFPLVPTMMTLNSFEIQETGLSDFFAISDCAEITEGKTR